jgi:hypothetical protein
MRIYVRKNLCSIHITELDMLFGALGLVTVNMLSRRPFFNMGTSRVRQLHVVGSDPAVKDGDIYVLRQYIATMVDH